MKYYEPFGQSCFQLEKRSKLSGSLQSPEGSVAMVGLMV